MITFGAITAASAFVIGYLVKHIKRIAIVISGAVFHASLILALYLWKPSIDDIPMFYVVAACLGLCDAIWQTQSNSKYTPISTAPLFKGLSLIFNKKSWIKKQKNPQLEL
jgi:predicted MFS family arabinose efflux permease